MTDRPSMPVHGDLIADRYRVERELKRGGMGAVYVARHVQTDREFALKLMSHELMGDAEAEARFEREARAESSIDHPGVVKVYDIGKHGHFPYMVMELLRGESLGDFLARGPMPPNDALLIMAKVLDAMKAAHAEGIVHRDLKPDNIYLCAGDGPIRPKILDFGISKMIDHDVHTKLTQTGVALGTPLYMSPEQVRGERDVDGRTDVYSLGVILYQMVTGKMPYTGANYAELVFKIINGEAPGVRELDPSLPEALEKVIRCAMAAQLEHRYPDMQSFATDLRDLSRGAMPSIEPRLSAHTRTQAPTPFVTTAEREALSEAPRRDLRPLWIGGGAVVLTAGIVMGALLGRGKQADGADLAAEPPVPAATSAAAPTVPSEAPGAAQADPAAPAEAPVVAPEPEQQPALATADAGTADGQDAPEPTEPAASEASAKPRRPTKKPRRQSDAPVLSITPRGGGTAVVPEAEPKPEPARPGIKMVDDEIIDPFQ